MRMILAAVLLLSVTLVSGCVQQDTGDGGSGAPEGGGAQGDVGVLSTTYTLAEVSAHATASDCWLAIDGKVYDVTGFIPGHPGKDAILQGCGKDATTLFQTRPMGSGTPHSERARDRLPDFYIGDLEAA